MKKTISIVIIVAMIVVAGMIAGCAGVEKPAEPLEKITFGVETSILPSAVWVAENKGYFQEEALEKQCLMRETGGRVRITTSTISAKKK